ncbi:hypothetical protein BDD12DRAFT_804402 [Trichophaea hybrida]|nr:hypothetical protein BDD12DRAFT_804402 [Trichophaea hybrida]
MIFSKSHIFLLLLSLFLSPIPASPSPRALRPINSRLHRRSHGSALIPADSAVISYREDYPGIYHADVTLNAHPQHQVLLLEDIEEYISTVSCHAGGIELRFSSLTEALLAANHWVPGVVVVTNHAAQGCGGEGDRVPYLFVPNHPPPILPMLNESRVKRIDSSNIPTLHLNAMKISWRQAAKTELRRRQKDGSEGQGNISIDTNIPDRVQLYPPIITFGNKADDSVSPQESGKPADKNSNKDSGKQPTNDKVVASISPNFLATCVGCTTSGQILVKAAFDVDMNFPDFGRSNGNSSLIVLDAAMLEVEIASDLKARANIEMFSGVKSMIKFTQSVLPVPITISPFQLGTFLSVGPIFDFEIEMVIEGPSASVNFMYGAELVVPKGAKATLDYGKSNKTAASGWDKSEITEIPFNIISLDGELSFAVNLTARPKFTFGVLVGDGTVATLDAGFELDLPKVYSKATAVKNVSTTCQPPSANDYTFHPSAIKISSGLGIALRAVAQFQAGGTGPLPALINQQFDYALFEKDFPAKDICLGFDTQRLGEMKNITEFKTQIDVVKVQAVVDKTGQLPSGVDEKSFEEAGGKVRNNTSTTTNSAVETGKVKAEKGTATTVGVGRLCAMLMAVGVGVVLL